MSLVLSPAVPRSSDGPSLQRRFPPETEELDHAAPLSSGGSPVQALGLEGYHDPRLKPLQLQQLSQQQQQGRQARQAQAFDQQRAQVQQQRQWQQQQQWQQRQQEQEHQRQRRQQQRLVQLQQQQELQRARGQAQQQQQVQQQQGTGAEAAAAAAAGAWVRGPPWTARRWVQHRGTGPLAGAWRARATCHPCSPCSSKRCRCKCRCRDHRRCKPRIKQASSASRRGRLHLR